MVAVIGGSEQWPSIRLHEALGFTRIGLLPAVGFKFGRWVDTVLMQRALGPGATTPPARSGATKEVSMAETFADPDRIAGYHAHIYYAAGDPRERGAAARRDRGTLPEARLGNWHDEPVGPHPVAMYQVAFAIEEFPAWCRG